MQSMRTPKDLIAVHVPSEDLGDYNRLRRPAGTPIDDEDKVVLGPFESLAECDRAIHDQVALREAMIQG